MTVSEKTHESERTANLTPARRRTVRRHRRPRRTRVNTAFAAGLAMLFFFGPNAVRLFGAHAAPIENRPLRPFPSPSAGWRFLPRLDDWAVDHLPLRDAAVRANGWVSEHVFRELSTRDAGSQEVLAGRDGWLFFKDDMRLRCSPAQPLDATLAQLDRLADLVTGLGHQFVVVVPPDKSAIEAGMLPASYPGRSCSVAANHAFWSRINGAPPVGYVDAYGPIAQVARQQGHAYYPTDTHWSPTAVAAYTRALVSRLDPGLLASTKFTTSGSQLKTTDLTKMIGMPKTEREPAVQVRRGGVTVHRVSETIAGYPAAHSTATTAGAPLFTPKTLILGDSFTEQSMETLAPFFADLTYANWNLADTDPGTAARLIRDSPVVVVEVVQREFEGGASPLLVAPMLDAVAAQLPTPAAHP
ncbi:hypothetical protein GCM10023322_62930 [Rugosimonospora acidiphila]|uniref:AlgX/AlgJ SGNH hydrolase-like domain-containing protein n=1 Tax=Rugosimonospora acidiphila TaxID=556531 RepID=A0ABP9SJD6_9ACTN